MESVGGARVRAGAAWREPAAAAGGAGGRPAENLYWRRGAKMPKTAGGSTWSGTGSIDLRHGSTAPRQREVGAGHSPVGQSSRSGSGPGLEHRRDDRIKMPQGSGQARQLGSRMRVEGGLDPGEKRREGGMGTERRIYQSMEYRTRVGMYSRVTEARAKVASS